MRIAQIAPLAECVPPRLYGGTERIVSYLTEELVERGHDVTLFASGDSRTRAKLIPCAQEALRLGAVTNHTPHHVAMLDKVLKLAGDFDILHFHIDIFHFPILRTLARPSLTTLHGRLDLPELVPFYSAFSEAPLVSISRDQRRPMPPVNWAGTVYHGLPLDLLPFTPRPAGGYLAFLGRISPEKGPDRAIEIAARSGLPLKIAAKVDDVDRSYWQGVIVPLLENCSSVEFVGEINEQQKARFLGDASALLFPIDWPEPFGLVMIEAMACGTPVIAYRRGSVPEVIDDDVSGCIVDGIEDAVEAVPHVLAMDRARVRKAFEARFTVKRMADDYLEIYRRLADADSDEIILRDGQIGPGIQAVA